MTMHLPSSNVEKTTPEMRAEIRALIEAGVQQAIVAKRFGISRTLVHRVLNGAFGNAHDEPQSVYRGCAFVYSGTPEPSDLEDVPLGRWT